MPGVPRATTSDRRRGRPACPCSAPPGSAGAPPDQGAERRSGGRNGRAAAGRGRGCRAGWWPPS